MYHHLNPVALICDLWPNTCVPPKMSLRCWCQIWLRLMSWRGRWEDTAGELVRYQTHSSLCIKKLYYNKRFFQDLLYNFRFLGSQMFFLKSDQETLLTLGAPLEWLCKRKHSQKKGNECVCRVPVWWNPESYTCPSLSTFYLCVGNIWNFTLKGNYRSIMFT